MVHVFRRIFRDLRNGRNIDAYVLTVIIVVFAVLGFFDDKLDDDLRWAAVLAALGVLLYRATLPETATEPAPDLLHDRSVFEQRPLSETFADTPPELPFFRSRNCPRGRSRSSHMTTRSPMSHFNQSQAGRTDSPERFM